MVCVSAKMSMNTAKCKTSSPPTGDKSNIQEYAAERTHETDVRRHCATEYSPVNTQRARFLGRTVRKATPGLYIMHSR